MNNFFTNRLTCVLPTVGSLTTQPLTRRPDSKLKVFFDDNGKTKRRMIMLPGSLTGGKEATEQAVKIMTEEGLMVNN